MDHRISQLLDEYTSIFGKSHLQLSDDLILAQQELEKCTLLKERQSSHTVNSVGERNSQQRLQEYDKFIEEKKKTVDRMDMTMLSETTEILDTPADTKKSKLEILAEERDLKRRRQTYKGGKAHAGKKSYTEVLREVIASQSELLTTIIKEDGKISHVDKKNDNQY